MGQSESHAKTGGWDEKRDTQQTVVTYLESAECRDSLSRNDDDGDDVEDEQSSLIRLPHRMECPEARSGTGRRLRVRCSY